MKKIKGTGLALIIGAVLAAVGLSLFLVGFWLNGWEYNAGMTYNSYTASGTVNAVEAEIDAGSVKIVGYDGDSVIVEYEAAHRYQTTVYEKNGKLIIESSGWSFGFHTGSPLEMQIKIPYSLAPSLDLEIAAGSAELSDVTLGRVEIEVDAGEANLNSVTCVSLDCSIDAGQIIATALACKDIDIEIDAGDAEISVNGVKEAYTIVCKVTIGSSNTYQQKGTDSSCRIKIEVDVGSIELTFSD